MEPVAEIITEGPTSQTLLVREENRNNLKSSFPAWRSTILVLF